MLGNFWESTNCYNWLFSKDEKLPSILEGKAAECAEYILFYMCDEWLDTYIKDNKALLECYKSILQSFKFTNLVNEIDKHIGPETPPLLIPQKVKEKTIILFRRCFIYGKELTLYSFEEIMFGCLHLALLTEGSTLGINGLVGKPVDDGEGKKLSIVCYLETVGDMFLRDICNALHLDFNVYLPSRYLLQFLSDSLLPESVSIKAFAIYNNLLKTNIFFFHNPYILAIACLYMGATQLQVDVREFLGSIEYDVDEMFEVVSEFRVYFETVPNIGLSPLKRFASIAAGKVNDLTIKKVATWPWTKLEGLIDVPPPPPQSASKKPTAAATSTSTSTSAPSNKPAPPKGTNPATNKPVSGAGSGSASKSVSGAGSASKAVSGTGSPSKPVSGTGSSAAKKTVGVKPKK